MTVQIKIEDLEEKRNRSYESRTVSVKGRTESGTKFTVNGTFDSGVSSVKDGVLVMMGENQRKTMLMNSLYSIQPNKL